MDTCSTHNRSPVSEIFPYGFLLSRCWPEHVERFIRRLLWLWLFTLTQGRLDEATKLVIEHMEEKLAAYCAWLIVINPDTPPAVLDNLVVALPVQFVARIAENRRTSPSTLAVLSNHQSPAVRLAVAENPNTPFAQLSHLVSDENLDIRYSLAENPDLPESLLIRLTDDDNPYVVFRAAKTLRQLSPAKPVRLRTSEPREEPQYRVIQLRQA